MDLSSSSIAILVVLGVVGFFVGNFMAARPRAQESRVADFRLMARKMGIYPKLITRPEWLSDTLKALRPPKADPYARTDASVPMIAQYTVMMDELKLPLAHYRAIDDRWQLLDQQIHTPKMQRQVSKIDGAAIDLPASIASYALGLSIKANHISLYWLDDSYQHSHKAYKLDNQQAEADLSHLKQQLMAWARSVNEDMSASSDEPEDRKLW